MTTVILNTTTRKVEVFSSARDVQARAAIAAHEAAADPHPQYIADLDVAAVATSGDAADLHYSPAGAGATARTAAEIFGETIRITDHGGVGDDETDNAAAAANARAAAGPNRPIVLNNGDYNASQTRSLYGAEGDYKDALGTQWLLGTPAEPTSRHEPILWLEKISDADRSEIANGFDFGPVYASLQKVGGDAYGQAITGYVRHTGGTGTVVGVHGRSDARAADAQVFGVWGYATVWHADYSRAVAAELNTANYVGQPNWTAGLGHPSVDGLIIAITDGLHGATRGIRIAGSPGKDFRTGIQIAQDTIRPSEDGNGEAILLRGGTSVGRRHGGIRLYDGNFDYGLTTAGAECGNNAAIWLAKGQRIVWGSVASSSTHIQITSGNILAVTGAALDVVSSHIRIAGTKVVDARVSGWGEVTGNLNRTAHTTLASTTASASYDQSEMQTVMNNVRDLSRRIGALLIDLGSNATSGKHGLIGA